MASFNEAWMLNKVTGEFFLTKNGFSQSITMANGPSQWRQGTCSDQKGNWVRYWFSGNRWFLEPQPSEEKWTPPLEGELLWLDPADYQMKLAWGELADCAAFEPEAALAPPASEGGAELENLPRGQDWRRYWVAWTAGALSALFLHLHRLVLHLYHVRLSSLLRGNVVKWSGELISSRASGTIATSPSASATRSFSWAWFQSAGWRCCMLVLLLVTVFTCLRTL